jgi:putative CocE/NonD family hydrolase
MKERALSGFLGLAMRLPRPETRDVEVAENVAITMDDGVDLLTDVYEPAGAGDNVPTVLVRSPYGRKGIFGALYGRVFAERGVRSILQSCRGTFGSGGMFRVALDERLDGLATIRWIEKQPWFDGRLAMAGPSYLGYVQWAVAADAGPSLRALCVDVSTASLASHWYANDSFDLDDAISWSALVATQETERWPLLEMVTHRRAQRIKRVINHLPMIELDLLVLGMRDARWRSIVGHKEDPSYWDPGDHRAALDGVGAAIQMTTGWHDLFLPLQLADYRRLVEAGNPPRLTIGPWAHTDSGLAGRALRDTLAFVRTEPPPRDGRVRVQLMGTREWREFPTWPPADYAPQRWHLHAGGGLSTAPPSESPPSRYVYDPADPTPSRGGARLEPRESGRKVQNEIEARDDVVCFTSDLLARDVEVIGPVEAEIHFASDLGHYDVSVRVCEVDERGRSFNVCDGIVRISDPGRADGAVHVVEVPVRPTAYRFRAGRRIRVQVASGAHPAHVRNLGTGEPMATGVTMQRAYQAIHHAPAHPSAVILPVRRGP